jgi:hypothetical protein
MCALGRKHPMCGLTLTAPQSTHAPRHDSTPDQDELEQTEGEAVAQQVGDLGWHFAGAIISREAGN